MLTIAVASGKGGVGKTAVAVHEATGMAAKGKRTLLVDLDPGGHASTWLLGDRADKGIAECMRDRVLWPAMVHEVPDRPGLFVAPASPALRTIGSELNDTVGREMILRELLRAKRKPQFDVVVIDCPPGVEFLPQAAVFAADFVIIPVTPGPMGISGAIDANRLVSEIRQRRKMRVGVFGCVLFQSDDRESVTEQTRAAIRQMGLRLSAAEVRVSTAGKQLSGSKATAFDPGADPRGFEDYGKLLKETEAML